MINNVSHITILVNDQDKALTFYTKKLGFNVHTDVKMEQGEGRWLTICTPENKDFEIALIQAQPDVKHLVGNQAGKEALLAVSTDDFETTYQSMKNNGVEFIDEPRQEPWGIGVQLKDLYGNIIYLFQPA